MDVVGPRPTACSVHIFTIYAIPWRFKDKAKLNDDEGVWPELGDLTKHYELYREQLPRLLPDRVLGDRGLRENVALSYPADVTVERAKLELFALPSKQVVLAVSMCLAGGGLSDEQHAVPVANVLEQCITGDVKVGDQMLPDALRRLFNQDSVKEFFDENLEDEALLPERHQLIFVARSAVDEPVPSHQMIDRMLYRKTLPYRPEFVEPKFPAQLNSRLDDGTDDRRGQLSRLFRRAQGDAVLGVVTPYVSLLYGHPEYVKASTFLSTVHAVGTAARFRSIWRDAYQQVLLFREQKQKANTGEQRRDDLEQLADSLGNLEFDLTFSVEFPLMRIETFRSNLYEAMDLGSQARTLSQMFDQLGGSLRSEITAIEVRERRDEDSRKRWNSVAAGVLSLIGVPVGFVIAFLGINTTQVPDSPKVSMWDQKYAWVYLIASAFALIPVFLIAVPYLRKFVSGSTGPRAFWSGLSSTVLGLIVLAWALISDRHGTGIGRVLDAIATASGAFFALVGLTTMGLYAVHRRRLRRRDRPRTERHGRLSTWTAPHPWDARHAHRAGGDDRQR